MLVGDARLDSGQDIGASDAHRRSSERALDRVRDGRRADLLRAARHVQLAVGADDGDLVLVGADADAGGEDVVEHEEVDALGGLLGASPVKTRAGLGGEGDAQQSRARGGGEHVDRAVELDGERRTLSTLDLALVGDAGLKSATAAAITSTSADADAPVTAAAISSALSTVTTSYGVAS